MSPFLASLVCVTLIVWLFWVDRDRDIHTSKALWIPTLWFLINSSRPGSMWLSMIGLNLGPDTATADVYTEGSPVDRAIFTALVIIGIIILVSRRRATGSLLVKNFPIALYFGFAAISMVWSDFPFVTFKHWIKGIGDVEMIMIIVTDPDAWGATIQVLSRMAYLLVPLSVLYCKYYPSIGRLMTKSWMNTFVGVTTQKNTLGWLCLLLGLAFLWRFRNAYRNRELPRRKGRLWAYAIILVLIVWLLRTSDSMTSFSSLILASIAMLCAGNAKILRMHPAIHVIVGGIVLVPIIALFFDPTGGMVGSIGRNPTLTGRTLIWTAVQRMPVSHLVGAGYESFWIGDRLEQLQAIIGFDVNEAHNGYLEMYLNLGWIGVGLLALMIVTGYQKVIAAVRANPATGPMYLAWFIAGLLASLTEAGFRMLSLPWIFFLFAMIAASATHEPDPVVSTTGNLRKEIAGTRLQSERRAGSKPGGGKPRPVGHPTKTALGSIMNRQVLLT